MQLLHLKEMTNSMKKSRISHLAAVALSMLATYAAIGASIDEEWMPEWIGSDDYEEGYFYYPTTIVCSERDDNWSRLNNGCFVRIGKTNAQGITRFTASYMDEQGTKRTVSHSFRDEGYAEFSANGHTYEISWDAIPYGCWLSVDPVYDANGSWQSEAASHFYLIDVKGSSEVAIPAEWRKARKLNGLFGEDCADGIDRIEGTVQLKCGKANKKGIAKVSLTITPFVGKKRIYRGIAVDVTQGDSIEVRWPQQKYTVTINGNEFFGEPIYGDMRPACSPNAVWNADIGGSFMKIAKFDFGEISENFDAIQRLPTVDSFDFVDVFSPVEVRMNDTRWTCAKASKLGRIKLCAYATGSFPCEQVWAVKTINDIDNIPALKLSYNATTGLFKGRFNVYVDRRKKFSAKVLGVMVDGVGCGRATCPKLMPESWVVTVE